MAAPGALPVPIDADLERAAAATCGAAVPKAAAASIAAAAPRAAAVPCAAAAPRAAAALSAEAALITVKASIAAVVPRAVAAPSAAEVSSAAASPCAARAPTAADLRHCPAPGAAPHDPSTAGQGVGPPAAAAESTTRGRRDPLASASAAEAGNGVPHALCTSRGRAAVSDATRVGRTVADTAGSAFPDNAVSSQVFWKDLKNGMKELLTHNRGVPASLASARIEVSASGWWQTPNLG